MKANLKELIKNQYKNDLLNKSQVEQLLSLRNKRGSNQFLIFASGLVVACLLTLFFRQDSVPIERSIVKEIAYNHKKHLEPEVLNSKISDIQIALSKVDFKLIESRQLNKDEWKIRGARYCSINGNIAIQIKVEKLATGKLYTMYQAKIPVRLKVKSYQEDIDGVRVRFWSEKGLLIGLAGE